MRIVVLHYTVFFVHHTSGPDQQVILIIIFIICLYEELEMKSELKHIMKVNLLFLTQGYKLANDTKSKQKTKGDSNYSPVQIAL